MRTLTALAVLLPVALAATTQAQAARVSVDVLQPADAPLPNHITRIAVVDRSGSSNAGQAILGTLESILTDEGVRADRDAAKMAVQTMMNELHASPRFEVVPLAATKKEVQASLWDTQMDAGTAKALCLDVCDAIIALESFDTDNMSDDDFRWTQAVATWRVYDGSSGAVLDSERMFADGERFLLEDVVDEGRMDNLMTADIGNGTALAYAERIAPTWQIEDRQLLGTQNDLRAGIRAAKAGDWTRATAHWQTAVVNGNARQRGKALFNLAVAAEIQGDLNGAIAFADDADSLLTRAAARNLPARLRMRVAEEAELADQLAAL